MDHLEINKKRICQKGIFLFFLFTFLFSIASIGVNKSYGEIIPSSKRINWKAGVDGGIPNVSQSVDVTDYGATGNDTSDDYSAFVKAISACTKGQGVYIPAGTYYLDTQLTIEKSVVLMGAGSDCTEIIIRQTGNNGIFFAAWGAGTVHKINSGYTKDSTSLVVDNASGLSNNDYIVIWQNNNSIVENGGYGTYGTFYGESSGNGDHCMSQIVKITNVSGTTLTLDRPIYYTFESKYDPEYKELPMLTGAGISNIKISGVSSGAGVLVNFYNCAYSWVKNVELANANNGFIQLINCYKCEIRDSYIHDALVFGPGSGKGIALWGSNSDILIENNIVNHTRHNIVIEGGGSGCVIGYNYTLNAYDGTSSVWLCEDIVTHGPHPYMNLFEGNYTGKLVSDWAHGSSSHATWFRNYSLMGRPDYETTMGLFGFEVSKYQRYFNLVGNVCCKQGDPGTVLAPSYTSHPAAFRFGWSYANSGMSCILDSAVINTMTFTGNYNNIDGSTQWDTNIEDQSLPASYYLSSKPSFFGDLPWPVIGPDLDPKVGVLPAKLRYEKIKSGVSQAADAPGTPSTLRVQ